MELSRLLEEAIVAALQTAEMTEGLVDCSAWLGAPWRRVPGWRC
jgi:hypothetical protein